MPVFIHIYWLQAEDNTQQLKDFIGAQSHGWQGIVGVALQ